MALELGEMQQQFIMHDWFTSNRSHRFLTSLPTQANIAALNENKRTQEAQIDDLSLPSFFDEVALRFD